MGAGFEEKPFGEPVDCSVVNTCTVTSEADRKSRQLLRKALRVLPPDGQAVATGCAVAARGGVKSLPSSTLRLPPEKKEEILALLGVDACPSQEPRRTVQSHSRALLKIQTGCDQFCTFCIVPYVRGRSKSRPIDEVVAEARAFEEAGYEELVLTGIHLSIYGDDLEDKPDLSHLLEAVLAATQRICIRLSSVEPDRFPLRLIDLMAREPRICPYLHLVLQHASDSVLDRMHRGYHLADYEKIVDRFMSEVPMATLSSDIMVGFPGETDRDFRELVSYIRRTPYYHLHVFPYSIRPGTSAAKFDDQIDPVLKKKRRNILLKLGQRKKTEFIQSLYGRTVDVFFESDHKKGWLKGTSHNGVSVIAKAGATLKHRSAQVLLTRRSGQFVVGKVQIVEEG